MAKLLKLDGIGSYVGPRTNNTHITKGQVVRVADDVADKMLEGFEIPIGEDGTPRKHWIEVEGVTPDHDFTDTPKAEVGVKMEVTGAGDVAETVSQSTAKRQTVQRAAPQRKSRSVAAKQ